MNYRIIPIAVILLFFVGCKEQQQPSKALTEADLHDLFQEYYVFKHQINPIGATKEGENKYNDTIANYISKPYQLHVVRSYDSFLERLAQFNFEALSSSRRLSAKVMQWDCEIKKEGLTNSLVTVASPMFDLPNFELLPINQIFSFQLEAAVLGSGDGAQPFETVSDYEQWLSRLEDYINWLETAIANMERGISEGVVLPKVIIQRTLAQLKAQKVDDYTQHLFYKPITTIPASFSSDEKYRLTNEYGMLLQNKLIPTYDKLRYFLEFTYLPNGTETSGIGALPHGMETYQYLIKYHTSTAMTPNEIHELGLREVARIQNEMEQIKESVGFTGNLKAFFDHVRTSKTQMPFTSPEQVIENFNSIHDRMQNNLSLLFDLKPKAAFEVRRTEAFREASASAEYFAGTKDGGRPGIFYVPIPDVGAYNTFSDEALFLHEAIPGHHYQLSLQQENESLPTFLHSEGMGVFVEGWALYAESLGKELGLYEDPYQYFGMLSMEIHRAIRLVVDTGLHAKGWSREEAIAYSLANEAASEASITSEIERYMIAPGQALSYKIGQLKIRELRAKAENAMGEDFQISAFHNQVLNSGSLPLVLLEEKIDHWIATYDKDKL